MSSNKDKVIKISYNIGEHDLETKRRQIRKFLNRGLAVKIQMRVFGREKHLYKDALDKLKEMFSEFKMVNAWSKNDNHYLFLK